MGVSFLRPNELPEQSTVEMRFDNDEGGFKFAAKLNAEILAKAKNVKSFRFLPPPDAGTDWNDFLRNSPSIG